MREPCPFCWLDLISVPKGGKHSYCFIRQRHFSPGQEWNGKKWSLPHPSPGEDRPEEGSHTRWVSVDDCSLVEVCERLTRTINKTTAHLTDVLSYSLHHMDRSIINALFYSPVGLSTIGKQFYFLINLYKFFFYFIFLLYFITLHISSAPPICVSIQP